MATIKLYKNISDNNYLDKNISLISTVEGTFRDEVSILEPIVNMELNEFPTFNYIYIEEFNRYYFVREIVAVTNKIYEIYCYIDVLMSYKDSIKNLRCIVDRSENKGNPLIDDEHIVVEEGYNIEYISIPSYESAFNNNDGAFVITAYDASVVYE